jgi:hypothetical protein
MIYKLLIDRRVRVEIPDLILTHRSSNIYIGIVNCYYPAMMRINKQLRDEYTTLVMPLLRLSIF